MVNFNGIRGEIENVSRIIIAWCRNLRQLYRDAIQQTDIFLWNNNNCLHK